MPPYNLPVCKALSERRYTPYFGAYRLSAAGTGRQCLPEIATGAKRPRNDNSGAGTILTPSRSYRKCSAGPGCPLPQEGAVLHLNGFSHKTQDGA